MKGTLYIQRNKGIRIEKPKPLECEIDMRRGDIAIAGVESDIKAILHRAEVEFISANGLKLRGIEEHGFNRLHYQEWWFIPIILCKANEKEIK